MKSKQSKFTLIIAFFFLIIGAFAQTDSSGIYKTSADFKDGKLSYAINYKTEKHSINDELIFNATEIKVKHMGTSYYLKKSETYGYRDTKGIDYRFVDNNLYKILSKGNGLMLYSVQTPAQEAAKGPVKYTTVYYFTKDITSPPQLLTKENLKAAYPDNHKFHDALDATFKDDKYLSEYDSFHKMYKVNHILEMNAM